MIKLMQVKNLSLAVLKSWYISKLWIPCGIEKPIDFKAFMSNNLILNKNNAYYYIYTNSKKIKKNQATLVLVCNKSKTIAPKWIDLTLDELKRYDIDCLLDDPKVKKIYNI